VNLWTQYGGRFGSKSSAGEGYGLILVWFLRRVESRANRYLGPGLLGPIVIGSVLWDPT